MHECETGLGFAEQLKALIRAFGDLRGKLEGFFEGSAGAIEVIHAHEHLPLVGGGNRLGIDRAEFLRAVIGAAEQLTGAAEITLEAIAFTEVEDAADGAAAVARAFKQVAGALEVR